MARRRPQQAMRTLTQRVLQAITELQTYRVAVRARFAVALAEGQRAAAAKRQDLEQQFYHRPPS